MAHKRIKKEMETYFQEGNQLEGVKVQFDEKNVFKMYFSIEGPKGTPYYGGVFKYQVNFTTEYPFVPFKITPLQDVIHITNYKCVLNIGANCCSPSYLLLGEQKHHPSLMFWDIIEEIKKCFYPEIFVDVLENKETIKQYLTDKKEFTYKVQLSIATESAKAFIPSFIVFQNNIKDFLKINSDSVFIDLHF